MDIVAGPELSNKVCVSETFDFAPETSLNVADVPADMFSGEDGEIGCVATVNDQASRWCSKTQECP